MVQPPYVPGDYPLEVLTGDEHIPALYGALNTFTTPDQLKAYINAVFPAVKLPALVATTTDITLAGLQTIDGVTLIAGDRVLVRDNTPNTENGIYVAASGAWERADDANETGDLLRGTLVFVNSGSTYGGTLWYVSTTTVPLIVDSTSILWTQFLMTLLIDNIVGPRSAGTAATSSGLIGAVYNVTAPAPTNGQQVALQLDSSANLRTVASPQFLNTKVLSTSVVNFGTSGLNSVVASSSGETVKVYRLYFVSSSAASVSMYSGTTARTGAMPVGAGGTLFFDLSAEPWWITASSEAFGISTTASTTITGSIEYIRSA